MRRLHFAKQPVLIGRLIVRMADELIKGKQLSEKLVDVPLIDVTPEIFGSVDKTTMQAPKGSDSPNLNFNNGRRQSQNFRRPIAEPISSFRSIGSRSETEATRNATFKYIFARMAGDQRLAG